MVHRESLFRFEPDKARWMNCYEFDAITFYKFDAITFYEFDAVTLLRERRCYVSSVIDDTIFRQCDVICFIEFIIRDSRISTSVVGMLFARRDRVSEY
ncbi:hypothetical protein U1Q18_051395 [Sarracenia purpurea var. burkii]